MHNWYWLIEALQVNYLNNIIEQDHRLIKLLTRPMQTVKLLNSASATLAGIEIADMIRKSQFDPSAQSGFA
tara:strand:+ start:1283 stop:1495 length:213 start_codon:yes stop_codon:yes gene_type:complete